MDWIAAKSYYIGYYSIDRFISIVFFHNYFLTWSISLIISLILPILFLFAPSSLHTTRTSHFLLICIVCLSNMFCIYFQIYMITGTGEPNLSFYTCRFIVYISTFAKPIGIYLTFLFSIERLIGKILSKLFSNLNKYHQLCQRLYKLFIFLGIIIILSIRLYQTLKYISLNQYNKKQSIDPENNPHEAVTDINSNSTDRNITFRYCFNSMNVDTYAKILSFYVMQYWYEFAALIIISIIFIILFIQQYRLPSSSSRFSINTKFYFSLAICFILSESSLIFFHYIVDDRNNNNSDLQFRSLQLMLFIFHFRCIFLPCIICLTICQDLKQFFYEFFILRPYLENIDENDDHQINTIDNRSEPFSSTQRTKKGFQEKFRRKLTKKNNHNEHFDNDESQIDM